MWFACAEIRIWLGCCLQVKDLCSWERLFWWSLIKNHWAMIQGPVVIVQSTRPQYIWNPAQYSHEAAQFPNLTSWNPVDVGLLSTELGNPMKAEMSREEPKRAPIEDPYPPGCIERGSGGVLLSCLLSTSEGLPPSVPASSTFHPPCLSYHSFLSALLSNALSPRRNSLQGFKLWNFWFNFFLRRKGLHLSPPYNLLTVAHFFFEFVLPAATSCAILVVFQKSMLLIHPF